MSCSEKNILDELLNVNLDHVVEKIFLHLDCQSLTNAEMAFPVTWKPFIQGNSKLYNKKLETISSWFLIKATEKRPQRFQLTPLGTRTGLIAELR